MRQCREHFDRSRERVTQEGMGQGKSAFPHCLQEEHNNIRSSTANHQVSRKAHRRLSRAIVALDSQRLGQTPQHGGAKEIVFATIERGKNETSPESRCPVASQTLVLEEAPPGLNCRLQWPVVGKQDTRGRPRSSFRICCFHTPDLIALSHCRDAVKCSGPSCRPSLRASHHMRAVS